MIAGLVHGLRALLEMRGSAPVILVVALIFYIWWITTRIDYAATNDFYTYYVAAFAFAAGKNVYALNIEQFDVWAQRAGVPTYAYPYYYPPLSVAGALAAYLPDARERSVGLAVGISCGATRRRSVARAFERSSFWAGSRGTTTAWVHACA